VKKGPVIAMLVVLGLSIWMAVGTLGPSVPVASPASRAMEIIVGEEKLRVEQAPVEGSGAGFRYRILNRGPDRATWMSEADFQRFTYTGGETSRGWLLQLFNVSTAGRLLWVALGLGGQLLFTGRMIVQWMASERSHKSVVPPVFWYMSFFGGAMLAAYFVWRHDVVGVIGQSTGLVVYARNLWLLHETKTARTRSARAESTGAPATLSETAPLS